MQKEKKKRISKSKSTKRQFRARKASPSPSKDVIDYGGIGIESLLTDISQINEDLRLWNKRLVVVDNAKDLASPKPRIAKDKLLVEMLALLIQKYYGGFLIDVLDTNSMDPWIDAGHKAIMIPFQDKAPYRREDLVVGDIIMFDREMDNTKNVLHRIIAVDKAGLVLTQGDNTTLVDGTTKINKIRFVCAGVVY